MTKSFAFESSIYLSINSNSFYTEIVKRVVPLLEDMLEKSCNYTLNVEKDMSNQPKNTVYLVEEAVGQSLDSYSIEVTKDHVIIRSHSVKGFYYGLCDMTREMKTKGFLVIRHQIQEPSFSNRGVLLDITRGKIPKVDEMKRMIRLLSFEKINQIQLYMEHTFRYSFTEDMNEGKGGYLPEEWADIIGFSNQYFVDLIPCIATFGHLYELLMTKDYKHLCVIENFNKPYSWIDRQLHHTIDVTNPSSYELITSMLDEVMDCFDSDYINICGDETFDLDEFCTNKGLDATKEYIEFLNKILDYVISKGKTPMYWGDVILKDPERLNELNQKAIPMHWWYEKYVNENEFYQLEKLNTDYYSCPGTNGWNRLMNDYDIGFSNITQMIDLGAKHKASGVLITDWGDFGHVNFLSQSIPELVFGARKAWNADYSYETFIQADEYDGLELLKLYENVSLEQLINFEDIMKWFYAIKFNDERYGDFMNEYDESMVLNTHKNLMRLENLKNELLNHDDYKGQSLSDDFSMEDQHKCQDMKELLCSINGIIWMLKVNKTMILSPQNTSDNTKDKQKLVSDIKTWKAEFSSLWLNRNRESELFRVHEVINDLCDIIEKGQ